MPRRADVMLSSEHAETQQDGVLEGIDHYQLPQSTVTKIAKSALPPNAKLQKDSVLALVKGSTVFINYIAAAAQEVAFAHGRKTIMSSDVLQALELTEFGDMVPSLNKELEEYRARLKKNPPPPKKDSDAAATAAPATKGKGRVSNGKAAPTVPANGVENNDPEEEPFSEPDIPDGPEEDEDLDEGEEAEQEDAKDTAVVDRMEVDDQELAVDARGIEAKPSQESEGEK
ncbi:hypothetical protein PIIN_02963 [Serendipita indica DSM 11827]|uniref:DNA polymerase epsilon subunit D n=1 Tax=Serendipita indica (strain DSM 11827) TaxID=1109443 RepID=G4U2C9_SERID|nr:hypothetical protein PIIN_02963 [Serendipita indica DSM 11827]